MRPVALVVAILLGSEWLNWRWSRMLVSADVGGAEAVVVPGFWNPGTKANFVNRWRVRAGLRSVDTAVDTQVIFSGGSTGRGASEARLMADYAKPRFDGRVLLEDRSRTTWENVANVVPLLEDVERIKIASHPAHALKARAYLHRQRPDLAEKLVRADDYRFGEWLILKPLLALYGVWKLRDLSTDERSITARTGPARTTRTNAAGWRRVR